MPTAISEFRDPIRAYIGDTHPVIKQFHPDQVDAAVRLVVNMGKAPGVVLATGQTSLTTDVTPTSPNEEVRKNWARIVLHAAKRFVMPNAAASSYRTRALSEVFGESREAVFDLLMEVYELEFGEKGE